MRAPGGHTARRGPGRRLVGVSLLAAALLAGPRAQESPAGRPAYPWPHGLGGGTVASRFAPPPGFCRLQAPPGSFGAWLRGLPVREGTPAVRLYDGRPKANQAAHCAVLDVDVGEGDLQQCADAVIRLRAEYLFSRGCDASIQFRFTSGAPSRWVDWRDGMRPAVRGTRVTWSHSAAPNGSYANFRKYLSLVFTYAGTASLARELRKVSDPAGPEPGDLYIQGGSPGHAVLVLDVAAGPGGERRFLLAQSYMPAQEIHVLRNPEDARAPWYSAKGAGPLPTPEWDFRHEDLRRFPAPSCP